MPLPCASRHGFAASAASPTGVLSCSCASSNSFSVSSLSLPVVDGIRRSALSIGVDEAQSAGRTRVCHHEGAEEVRYVEGGSSVASNVPIRNSSAAESSPVSAIAVLTSVNAAFGNCSQIATSPSLMVSRPNVYMYRPGSVTRPTCAQVILLTGNHFPFDFSSSCTSLRIGLASSLKLLAWPQVPPHKVADAANKKL